MKRKLLTLLCMILALVTLSSCASCNEGDANGTTTLPSPKNPYFYLWINEPSPDGQYSQFGIKANALPDEIVEVKLEDFYVIGKDGKRYEPVGFLAGYSAKNEDGQTKYEYSFHSSNTYSYDDSEKNIIPIYFAPEAADGVLYHKGEKVFDRSGEYEEQMTQGTTEATTEDPFVEE